MFPDKLNNTAKTYQSGNYNTSVKPTNTGTLLTKDHYKDKPEIQTQTTDLDSKGRQLFTASQYKIVYREQLRDTVTAAT